MRGWISGIPHDRSVRKTCSIWVQYMQCHLWHNSQWTKLEHFYSSSFWELQYVEHMHSSHLRLYWHTNPNEIQIVPEFCNSQYFWRWGDYFEPHHWTNTIIMIYIWQQSLWGSWKVCIHKLSMQTETGKNMLAGNYVLCLLGIISLPRMVWGNEISHVS